MSYPHEALVQLSERIETLEGSDQKIWEMLKAQSNRLDSLVMALDVLGQIVKLQGERIERLEDKE